MKLTELFGSIARPTHEWIEFSRTASGEDLIRNQRHGYTYAEKYSWFVEHVYKFLSRPMSLDMFVRPEKPPKFIYSCDCHEAFWTTVSNCAHCGEEPKTEENQAYKAWQNWKCLFEGEWKVTRNPSKPFAHLCRYNGRWLITPIEEGTLNDFLHATRHLELKYNPEYELTPPNL